MLIRPLLFHLFLCCSWIISALLLPFRSMVCSLGTQLFKLPVKMVMKKLSEFSLNMMWTWRPRYILGFFFLLTLCRRNVFKTVSDVLLAMTLPSVPSGRALGVLKTTGKSVYVCYSRPYHLPEKVTWLEF